MSENFFELGFQRVMGGEKLVRDCCDEFDIRVLIIFLVNKKGCRKSCLPSG